MPYWIAQLAVALVALQHLYVAIAEIVLWSRPVRRRSHGLAPEMTEAIRTLAANQGLHNGFLGAGLLWSAAEYHRELMFFFLGCAVIAGVFGGATVARKLFLTQALPALAALALLMWAGVNPRLCSVLPLQSLFF